MPSHLQDVSVHLLNGKLNNKLINGDTICLMAKSILKGNVK